MPFNINHLTPVYFGEGVSKETGKKLKEYGISRIFCVFDKGIKEAKSNGKGHNARAYVVSYLIKQVA